MYYGQLAIYVEGEGYLYQLDSEWLYRSLVCDNTFT